MEQARRPTLADHVHRTAPMGARVLINETRYKHRFLPNFLGGAGSWAFRIDYFFNLELKPPKIQLIGYLNEPRHHSQLDNEKYRLISLRGCRQRSLYLRSPTQYRTNIR